MPRPASRIACAWWRAARPICPSRTTGSTDLFRERGDEHRRQAALGGEVLREALDAFAPAQCSILPLRSRPKGEPDYPLPWAAGPAASFLCSPEETGSKFSRGVRDRDLPGQTGEVLPDLRENRPRLEEHGLPPLGLQTSWASELGNLGLTRPGMRTRAVLALLRP